LRPRDADKGPEPWQWVDNERYIGVMLDDNQLIRSAHMSQGEKIRRMKDWDIPSRLLQD